MTAIDIIQFKTEKAKERFALISPTLQTLCLDMADFCNKRGMPFMLTETMTSASEDAALNRVSESHQTGRATDIRTKDWSKEFLDLFLSTFESKYGSLGATSKDGKQRLCVYHDSGHGQHIHCQLSAKYAVKERLK